MGQESSSEGSSEEKKRFNSICVLLQRNIMKDMFLWDFGNEIIVDHDHIENINSVFVKRIHDYWMSNELKKEFIPLRQKLMQHIDEFDEKWMSACSVKQAAAGCNFVMPYKLFFECQFNIIFDCWVKQVMPLWDKHKLAQKERENEAILSICIANLYYIKAFILFAKRNHTSDFPEDVLKRAISYLKISLSYYRLSKSYLLICMCMISLHQFERFASPMTQETLTQLEYYLGHIKWDPFIYSKSQYEKIIAVKQKQIELQVAKLRQASTKAIEKRKEIEAQKAKSDCIIL